MFHWFLDVAIENSYIGYSERVESIPRRTFIENLANQLLLHAEKSEEEEKQSEIPPVSPKQSYPIATYRITKNNKHADIRLEGVHKKLQSGSPHECIMCRRENRYLSTRHYCDRCEKYICESHWSFWHNTLDI